MSLWVCTKSIIYDIEHQDTDSYTWHNILLNIYQVFESLPLGLSPDNV